MRWRWPSLMQLKSRSARWEAPTSAKGVPHGLFVRFGKDAQPPGVGDAARRRKLETGGQLGAAGVGEHQGQPLCAGSAGVGGKVLAAQQHGAAEGANCPANVLSSVDLPAPFGPIRGQDLSAPDAEGDGLGQRCFAVAHG